MTSESAQRRVKALRYYTPAADAFTQSWASPRLWLNPPYGRGIFDRSISELAAYFCCGTISAAMVLTNNVTETRSGAWLLATASAVWFPPRRISFIGQDGEPVKGNTRGQMLTLLGGDRSMAKRLAEGKPEQPPLSVQDRNRAARVQRLRRGYREEEDPNAPLLECYLQVGAASAPCRLSEVPRESRRFG